MKFRYMMTGSRIFLVVFTPKIRDSIEKSK